ncbi:MAG: hypothetical protein JSS20_00990 [Proteobacteria bacterium]|nr:hypothetical protein [Pseudomonadota bacterium]
MTGKMRIFAAVGCACLALTLAACSGSNPLTTGTLLGGSSSKEGAPLPPESPIDRAKHVGTTSARAQRCGYVFDPATLRSNYVGTEQQQGAAGDQLAKVEKAYDLAFTAESKTIAGDADYCSDGMTSRIKKDLNQVLAGDYSSPKKSAVDVSSFSSSGQGQLDREKIFNPTR